MRVGVVVVWQLLRSLRGCSWGSTAPLSLGLLGCRFLWQNLCAILIYAFAVTFWTVCAEFNEVQEECYPLGDKEGQLVSLGQRGTCPANI